MKTKLSATLVLCVLSFTLEANAKNIPENQTPLGTTFSQCSSVPLWMSKNLKVRHDRDVYRAIVEKVNANPARELVDASVLEQKLRSIVGNRQVVCKLTLNKSGRVEEATILGSSGKRESDEKAIALLKEIEQYGSDWDCRKTLSYQVEMPMLRISPMVSHM